MPTCCQRWWKSSCHKKWLVKIRNNFRMWGRKEELTEPCFFGFGYGQAVLLWWLCDWSLAFLRCNLNFDEGDVECKNGWFINQTLQFQDLEHTLSRKDRCYFHDGQWLLGYVSCSLILRVEGRDCANGQFSDVCFSLGKGRTNALLRGSESVLKITCLCCATV